MAGFLVSVMKGLFTTTTTLLTLSSTLGFQYQNNQNNNK